MTVTPIAMAVCGFTLGFILRDSGPRTWYVRTRLYHGTSDRYGVNNILIVGAALCGASIVIHLLGIVPQFPVGFGLVGVGWNFLFTGGTALLTETA